MRRAVLTAIGPTARTAHLGVVAATAALGTAPTIVVALGPRPVSSTSLVVAALVGGAAVGWVTEDPAVELLSSLPVATPIRAALRVAMAAAIGVVGLLVAIGLAAVSGGVPVDAADRVPELLVAGGAALAMGTAGARRQQAGVGPTAVATGLLVPLVVAAFAFRWTWLPAFGAGPVHDRWWVLAAGAALVSARMGRDPARS